MRIPSSLKELLTGYTSHPATSGQSGATVHRLTHPHHETLYLKHGSDEIAKDIRDEMHRLHWLSGKIPVPQVRAYFETPQQAWMLTTALPGQSAYALLTKHPEQRPEIVTAIATFLRRLHSLPAAECPFNSNHLLRMADAQRNIALGRVDESDFDENHAGWTATQVWSELTTLLPSNFTTTLTHGDFSLDNIFLSAGQVSGCIDTGRTGLADPYQDLAILWHNLEEFGAGLQTQLFHDYRIASPDTQKIRFHLCLDELF